MKQFILDAGPDRNNQVRLEGDDYRYLVKVRRLARGEFFPAALPNGAKISVRVLSAANGVLTGKCFFDDKIDETGGATGGDNAPEANSQTPPLILFQALPKGEKMDLIVRQAAESGIAEIVPFVSEFSVAKPRAGKEKYSRWERIIKEARQQSGSKTATIIRPPVRLNELLDYWKKMNEAEAALGLIFHHQRGLEQKSLHSYLDNNARAVVLAVGPEGGFSEREVPVFLENGFKALTIGDTILRTETAALYFAAAIKVILLEKNSWELKQPEGSV